jgi:3-oxoadipate enol-lactonase
MKTSANGISINYQVEGQGQSLVLIHGAGDNLNMWYHQIPALSKNYKVISYDVRGSGESEIPEGEYSIALFAEDAYQLMKVLGVDSAYFLGYSMGGRIAFDLALKYPDLVKALVLANSSLGLQPASPEALKRRQINLDLLDKGDLKGFSEKMTTSAFSPGFISRNPLEFSKYMQVKLQNKADGLSRLMRGMAPPDHPPDLSKLECPVLIVVGEQDQYMGVGEGNLAKEAIANSELMILPSGHASAIELPERFNAGVLEFLKRISRDYNSQR